MATTQPPAAPAKTALWEDFIDIFTSPSEVFARRSGSNPWLPITILTALCAIIYFATKGLMQPIFDAEFARGAARAMAKDPSITAAQMEQFRGMGQKIAAFAIIIGVPISIVFVGVLVWLVGKLFGAVESIGDAMVIATYAWIPRVVAFIVAAVIAAISDPSKLNSMFSTTLSVGKFMDPDATQHQLMIMAGRVDVFVLWQTVLLGIGLSVLGKIPRANAFIAAAILWVVGSGIGAMMQR